MTRKIILTLAPTILGTALSIVCLIKTTPVTMTAFFFIGIPSFILGLILWAIVVVRDLKEHKVL